MPLQGEVDTSWQAYQPGMAATGLQGPLSDSLVNSMCETNASLMGLLGLVLHRLQLTSLTGAKFVCPMQLSCSP